MSLPSQQRRGAASGRANNRAIRKHRRRQGVPAPLKAAAAVALLAIVLWTGWAVLGGPKSTQAEGGESNLTPAVNVDHAQENPVDPALDAILGDSSRSSESGTGMLTAAINEREPVKQAQLPDPLVIESNPTHDLGAPSRTGQNARIENEALSTPPLQAPVSTPAGDNSNLSAAERVMLDADILSRRGRLVEARSMLNGALLGDSATESQRAQLRQRLIAINNDLVFGPKANSADSMTEMYRVQSGDSLARIASRRELTTHYKLISRVNGISDPSKIRTGQNLKLVRGPFHAVVDKSDYRIDVYHGSPDSPGDWVFITSFPVGLGENTPAGSFVISTNKLENPGWVNPFDSTERYDRNDPKNPIGDFWLGLDGVGPSAVHVGFGLHGTIEPESIGKSMSMGCVRLGDEHVATIYELLVEQISVVHIVE